MVRSILKGNKKNTSNVKAECDQNLEFKIKPIMLLNDFVVNLDCIQYSNVAFYYWL